MCEFHKAWTGVGHMLGWIVRGVRDLGEVCMLSGNVLLRSSPHLWAS